MVWIANQNQVVVTIDKLTVNCEKVLNILGISPTQIRVQILKVCILHQRDHFTIAEIHKHIQRKIKRVSLSIIADNLLLFKIRGILSVEKSKIHYKENQFKPGRPATKHTLSKEFIKVYTPYFTSAIFHKFKDEDGHPLDFKEIHSQVK